MLAFAAALAVLAIGTQASPIDKRALTTTDILQYALTLEHLENKFYSDALAKYDTAAFVAAGYPSWVRGRFAQIAEHEASHVALLQGALGAAATKPCVYSFPYTDVKSFIGLAQVVENVGTSAYLGAASSITVPAVVTIAGSILTTEARHQGWLASAVQKQAGWSGAYDTPLSPSAVYNIAAQFITSCPAGNPSLPVSIFKPLTVPATAPGSRAKLSFSTTGASEWLIVYSGLTVVAQPIAVDGTVTIPAGLQGISYALVSTTYNTTAVTDANTVAGPAIFNYPFNSDAKNPNFTGM